MKVLFCCVPQTGHLAPLLPLARAFADQRDDVVIASGADLADAVAGENLEFRETGAAFGAWFGALAARTRGAPGDGLPPERVTRYFVPRLFGEIGAASVVDDLLVLGKEVRPDLVVYDTYSFAAPLAAAALGAPAVHHTLGPAPSDEVLELARDAVSPMWREFGLDVPPAAGVYAGTTLAVCPASLDPVGAAIAGARPIRPTALPVAGAGAGLGDRRLVYVTLGTFSNHNVALFRLILDALAAETIDVLVTVGRDTDPAALRGVPANARVERFVPQAEVLPRCSAVVHHAGSGTLFGALAHGLPAVALPQSADNFANADLLSASGLARVLAPAEVCAESVRGAVREVLDTAGYRDRAALVAQEIAAMPSPADVAAELR